MNRAFLLAVSGVVAGLSTVAGHIAKGADQKQIVIGYSQRRVAGSDWWKTLIAGVTSEGEKLGVKVEVLDAGGDTVRQNSDVETLITKGVDGVIMNANDPRGVSASVLALKKAGIPLAEVNSNLDPLSSSRHFLLRGRGSSCDGAKAGKGIAEEVAKKFKPTDSIKLAIIGGYPGDVISDLRKTGFLQAYDEYFKDHPGPRRPYYQCDTDIGYRIRRSDRCGISPQRTRI